MNERAQIAVLVKIAFLNAIILSFLSVQFVMPAMFLLFLAFLPVVFALMFYYAPARMAILGTLALTIIASVLFTPYTGLWTLLYGLVGTVLGLAWRLGFPWPLRLAGTILTFAISLGGIIALFMRVTQIGWQELRGVVEQVGIPGQFPLTSVIAVGLVTWAAALGIVANWTLGRVLGQLEVNAA